MDKRTLLVAGLIALLFVLFLFFNKPGQNFSCDNISDKVTFINQEIIVDNVSCPFILSSPADARFSYDDRIDDRPSQVGGKQLILNLDCHGDITEQISPLKTSYNSANEVYLRHSDGQVYFCRPLVRV